MDRADSQVYDLLVTDFGSSLSYY